MTRTHWTAAAAALLLAATALGATPAEKCESDKNKEAGKYAGCRQKAEAKLALTGDGAARALALQKCADRYGAKWPAIESRAGGTCPSTRDQSAIQRYLDTASGDVAAALAGGTLANRGHRLQTGMTMCGNASGEVIPCAGTGQDGAFQKGLARAYVDNGDGTITDTGTGLMWEKLSDDNSMHDKDRYYTWADAFAVKVAWLNQQRFAGYTDWRLPNVNELQSLLDYGTYDPAVSPAFNTGCVPGCTVLTCSCTHRFYYGGYWSSTHDSFYPPWSIEFYYGDVRPADTSTSTLAVRAVRGGS